MLAKLISEGFGNDLDLNCAEKIIYGANQVYKLELDHNALKMAAGFGGGMAIESVCGALTGGIMVIGRLGVVKNAHESGKTKQLVQELFAEFKQEMDAIDCTTLKENYRTEELKCHNVILKAATVLDKIVARNFMVK